MKYNKINDCPENKCKSIELSNHKQYLEILNKTSKLTSKIVIVQIDGPDKEDEIVNTAFRIMPLENKEIVNEWYGTIAEGSRGAIKYTFIKKHSFFEYLASFESFFIGKIDKYNNYDVIYTDFGIDDIAFLGDNGELLFYTTTHEGEAYLNEKLL